MTQTLSQRPTTCLESTVRERRHVPRSWACSSTESLPCCATELSRDSCLPASPSPVNGLQVAWTFGNRRKVPRATQLKSSDKTRRFPVISLTLGRENERIWLEEDRRGDCIGSGRATIHRGTYASGCGHSWTPASQDARRIPVHCAPSELGLSGSSMRCPGGFSSHSRRANQKRPCKCLRTSCWTY